MACFELKRLILIPQEHRQQHLPVSAKGDLHVSCSQNFNQKLMLVNNSNY